MHVYVCSSLQFGSDDEVVLATLLALKEEWPIIPLSTYFMKYSARNGEKTETPYRPPSSLGTITLKIKEEQRFYPVYFQHTFTASDGTVIKIEPLLGAAGG